jgi:small conductance mechanosensitive channel
MGFKEILIQAQSWIPSIVLFVISVSSFMLFKRFILHPKKRDITESRWIRQLTLSCIVLMFLILILLSLPISETMKGQFLNLLGIALMATITLSSTTFVSNTMAGFMLKAIDGIKPGDFLKVGDHTGRVSEQGLLHTEIQTEDRDLTTLPNLFLVTSPVTVVRSSGTIISATISLGYDVPRAKIEALLILAGEKARLVEPFVQILDLGDFSVTYRVAGFLSDVRYLISFRSKLRGFMLDVLHENNIEIVSPNFMNQRILPVDKPFIPKSTLKKATTKTNQKSPEDIIFDKADVAESKEKIKEILQKNKEELIFLEELIGKDSENEELKEKLVRLEKRNDYLQKILESKVNE